MSYLLFKKLLKPSDTSIQDKKRKILLMLYCYIASPSDKRFSAVIFF